MKKTIVSLPLFLSCVVLFAQPNSFQSTGIGGGGALYSPSFNPANPNEIFMGCDMTELFHTSDQGESWGERPFSEIQGGVWSEMQYTNDPNIRYCVSHAAVNNVDKIRPMKSTDGGATWTPISPNVLLEQGNINSIYADYDNPNRLVLNDYSRIFYSSDGGATFTLLYTTGSSGIHVAGVFFDGSNIYICREDGIFYSTDNGATFSMLPVTGFLTAGEKIKSFAAAKTGTAIKFECLTAVRVWAGVRRGSTYWADMKGIYTMNNVSGTWQPHLAGINSYDYVNWLGMARTDTSTVYSAGGNYYLFPIVMKSVNQGAWQHTFFTTNNANISTGWAGHQGDGTWDYGSAPQGFQVCPTDASKVIFTDLGFSHLTTNGGTSWKQTYLSTANQNPAGAPTPKYKKYAGNGLQNTSCWDLLWLSNNDILAGFTDIRGLITSDAGATWKFLPVLDNSVFKAVKNTDGKVYIATSSVHDLYQSNRIYDAQIDAGDGAIYVSTNNGAAFSVLKDFNHPLVWIAIDPTNSNRMYASVLHSDTNIGGVWVTSDLQNGTTATWTKLAAPAGANGHPYNIRVLNDGNLVVSFSARVPTTTSQFTATSGIFYYETATQTWSDRSHPHMKYWTKDVVLDPNDASQNTWYGCVFQGWGSVAVQGTGGLFKTTDRGLTWTKISTEFRVNSATVAPNNPNILYYTTETKGLWYSTNVTSSTPTFSVVSSYPFRQPMRTFFNPNNQDEVWITSFGAGMKFGTSILPLAIQLFDFKGVVEKNKALLNWEINDTKSLKQFEIEKSSDGTHFEKIGNVSFSKQTNYEFKDFLFQKSAFYRLKIMENDGHFTYSKIIFLVKEYPDEIVVYPNPTTGILTSRLSEFETLPTLAYTLYNSVGQVVLQGETLPEQIDLQGFMNGIYFLKVGEKKIKIVKE